MASPLFEVYDRNLRRMFWLCFIDQLESDRRNSFRASLIVNAHTGRPIGAEKPDGDKNLAALQLGPVAASG